MTPSISMGDLIFERTVRLSHCLARLTCIFARFTAPILLIGLLCACDFQKPDYPRQHNPSVLVSVSSDGKLIAVVENVGTPSQRLRIKWTDKDEPWQEQYLPMHTGSIQFALEGYDLLLSHALHDNTEMSQIIRWNVSDGKYAVRTIYQAPHLYAPIEVKPDIYIARTCRSQGRDLQHPDRSTCQGYGGGTYWVWLQPGVAPIRLTPTTVLPLFSQPNVTDEGFFWTTDSVVGTGMYRVDRKKLQHPFLLTFAFPGGTAPKIAVEHFSKESDLICDQTVQRCLRRFLRNEKTVTGLYVYDHEVVYRGRQCPIAGVQGYADLADISPDGRTAVIPVARVYTEPRKIVVLKFKDGQCTPESIQRLNLSAE